MNEFRLWMNRARADCWDLLPRLAFIDASFAPAKKKGKTKRGEGTEIMAVADRRGLPVSVRVEVPRRTR